MVCVRPFSLAGLAIALGIAAACTPYANARQEPSKKADSTPAESKAADPQTAKAGAKSETAKPARVATRKDYIDMPGAPRNPLDGFRGRTKAMPFQKPSDEQWDAVRRGRVERQAIDAVAKAMVYSLANPHDELNIGKNVEEALKFGRMPGKTEFTRLYKSAVCRHARDLLDNSLVVQVNAMLLLARLMDGSDDVKDAVPIFVDVLKDGKREDAVLYLAMRGLEISKQQRLLDVKPEREAVIAMIELAKKPGNQPLLFEQIVTTLGSLGMAYTGDLPERAEVATFLANIVVDAKNPLRLRYEAAHGLGSVNPTPLTRVNWELAGFVMGSFINDLAKAHKENKVPEETFRYWLYNLATDLVNLNRASGNEKFKALVNHVREFAAAAIDKQEADPSPIDDWLKSVQPLKDLRLGPAAAPVTLPAAK